MTPPLHTFLHSTAMKYRLTLLVYMYIRLIGQHSTQSTHTIHCAGITGGQPGFHIGLNLSVKRVSVTPPPPPPTPHPPIPHPSDPTHPDPPSPSNPTSKMWANAPKDELTDLHRCM